MKILKAFLSKTAIVTLAIILGGGGLMGVQASLLDGTPETYYLDADGDGFGNSEIATTTMEIPEGYTDNDDDCNDDDELINPDASEACDGVDNNCSGVVDEDVTTTYYQDLDGDTYGNPSVSTSSCSVVEAYVEDNTDCNDTASSTNTDATEVEDGVDNNCDGNIDEGFEKTYYLDTDGDGYGDEDNATTSLEAPVGYVLESGDCDDGNSTVNPGVLEVCDTIDNNCNGEVDEGVLNTYYGDVDNDGYGIAENIYMACEIATGYVEVDGDCNDEDNEIYPGAEEVYDGKDNNCDGNIDEDLMNTYYADVDGNGYGDNSNATTSLEAPVGYTEDNTDCDDTASTTNPGAIEIKDGVDNNCDGVVDEEGEDPIDEEPTVEEPGDAGEYQNHGQYMKHMNQYANMLKSQGVITGKEKGQMTSEAAHNKVKKQNKGSEKKQSKSKK